MVRKTPRVDLTEARKLSQFYFVAIIDRLPQRLPLIGCLLFALVFSYLGGVNGAQAHSSVAAEVFNGEQGTYHLVVRAASSRLVVGNVHLSLLITETNRENLVTDAVVTLQATSSYGSHSEVVETYHELANPAYYEANIPINEVGEWRFRVNVEGPMGVEEFLIPLEFEEPTVPWGSVIALLVIGLLAVPLVVIGVRRKKKVEPNVDSEVT